MLPLWLAKSLADRRHVEIMLPKHYGANYRNALKANEGQDLTAQQDLSHSSDFYFDVGMQLSQMYVDLVPSPLSRARVLSRPRWGFGPPAMRFPPRP
jgi:hypothetical protein